MLIQPGQVVTFEFEPDAGADGGLAPIGYDVGFAGGVTVRHVAPVISVDLFTSVGRIMANWATLEFLLNEMNELLLAHLGQSQPELRAKPVTQRLDKSRQWLGQALGSCPTLLLEYDKFLERVRRVKNIRDCLAHRVIMGSATAKKQSIIFADRNGNFFRPYRHWTMAELHGEADEITRLCGILDAVGEAPNDMPLPPQELSQLRKVLGKDRWDAAKLRAIGLQL